MVQKKKIKKLSESCSKLLLLPVKITQRLNKQDWNIYNPKPNIHVKTLVKKGRVHTGWHLSDVSLNTRPVIKQEKRALVADNGKLGEAIKKSAPHCRPSAPLLPYLGVSSSALQRAHTASTKGCREHHFGHKSKLSGPAFQAFLG